jgi:hypothetical protein
MDSPDLGLNSVFHCFFYNFWNDLLMIWCRLRAIFQTVKGINLLEEWYLSYSAALHGS